MTLGRRLAENPLITPTDVRPSLPELEVVSVFNAAVAKVGDEVILLLRIAERPRSDIDPPPDARTLDLDRPQPVLKKLRRGYRKEDLVGMCVLDTTADPPRVSVAYLPVNLPGLDLHDRRSIRYRNPRGQRRGMTDGYTEIGRASCRERV